MNSAARKPDFRSRERIGSDDARRWVRKIKLGNPYAKSILMAVANYMNENGAAWPGIATISQDTDISEDTVVSRLRWCESIGAIALFKCWVDENGNRNYEGRGRITSNEIRFLLDADIDEVQHNALGENRPQVLRGAAKKAHISAVSQADDLDPATGGCSNSDAATGLDPVLAPGLPPPPAARIEELESKKDSPLTPQGGLSDPDFVDEGSEAKPLSGSDTWPDFERAYCEPIIRQSLARNVWAALSESERLLAVKAARGYNAWRRKQRNPPSLLGAHLFLKERDAWPGFAKDAPPDPIARTFVQEKTSAFEAARVAALIGGWSLPPTVFDVTKGVRGFWRNRPLPPDLLGLAVFADKPVEQWTSLEAGTRPYFAWSDRIYEWTGVRPTKLRVPCLWPPRKDGSISPQPESDTG
jgi:hypothetical protein